MSMNINMFLTVIFSLLSALTSSFLAAYLTYRYTELSWRRRKHFEDIKENCLRKVLEGIEYFERHFALYEDKISGWVKAGSFSREPPSSEWCKLFSFEFERPPTTHYRILLHDLENHFPELVKKLRSFEEKMRELCPLYDKILYELTKLVYIEAGNVTTNIPGRDILTEAVIMILAGYGEEYWPNDKRALESKGLLEHIDVLVNRLKDSKMIKEFNEIRENCLFLVSDVKKDIMKILHSQKLPGKCNLY